MATRQVWVWRCPKCGSTSAGPDEERSAFEITYMACTSCGHGEHCDSWQRDSDWLTQIEVDAASDALPAVVTPLAPGREFYDEPAAPEGCARCLAADASAAYASLTAKREAMLEQESHFSLQVTSCTCGQRWCVAFTERVDWNGGEDDQTWVCVPLTSAEVRGLTEFNEGARRRYLDVVTRGRRFLVRAFPTEGSLTCWWRDSGFAIGPHD